MSLPLLHEHDRAAPTVALAARDVSALVDAFTQCGTPTEAAVEHAQTILASLHIRKRWLCCGCLADRSAMLFPCQREGRYYLTRNALRPHSESCPFYRLHEAPEAGSETAGNGARREYSGSVLLLKAGASPPEGASNAVPVGVGGDREPPTPALARILWTWMQRAGYTRVRSHDVRDAGSGPIHVDVAAHYRAIDVILKDRIARHSQLTLQDILATHPRQLNGVRASLRKNAAAFPETRRPVGFFAGRVDRVDRSTDKAAIVWRSTDGSESREHVAGRVAELIDREDGPYFGIALLAKDPRSGSIGIQQAFAQPVLSRGLLLPVDSAVERHAAKMLLEQAIYWRRRYDIAVTIEKPLFDIDSVGSADVSRPDFLIRLSAGAVVVVEVAGMSTPEYVERKARTQATMRRIAGVRELIEIGQELAIDDSSTRQALTKIVRLIERK